MTKNFKSFKHQLIGDWLGFIKYAINLVIHRKVTINKLTFANAVTTSRLPNDLNYEIQLKILFLITPLYTAIL